MLREFLYFAFHGISKGGSFFLSILTPAVSVHTKAEHAAILRTSSQLSEGFILNLTYSVAAYAAVSSDLSVSLSIPVMGVDDIACAVFNAHRKDVIDRCFQVCNVIAVRILTAKAVDEIVWPFQWYHLLHITLALCGRHFKTTCENRQQTCENRQATIFVWITGFRPDQSFIPLYSSVMKRTKPSLGSVASFSRSMRLIFPRLGTSANSRLKSSSCRKA